MTGPDQGSTTDRNADPRSPADGQDGLRRSSAKLLGAYISLERKRHRLSAEALLDELGRTEVWLNAVERGDLVPTRKQILLVEAGFLSCRHPVNVRSVLAELEQNPFGNLAMRIRRDSLLPYEADTEDGDVQELSGSIPVITAIRSQDRFLILAPVALTLAVIVLMVALLDWAIDGEVDLDSSLGLIGSGGVFAFSAFFLHPVDKFLDWTGGMTRTKSVKTRMRRYQRTRYVNGLCRDQDSLDWYHPDDQRHLLPGARQAAWSEGLLTEFSERLASLLFFVALISFAAVATLLAVRGWTLRILAPSVLAVVVVGLFATVLATAHSASRRVLAALKRGCGLRLDQVKTDELPKLTST